MLDLLSSVYIVFVVALCYGTYSVIAQFCLCINTEKSSKKRNLSRFEALDPYSEDMAILQM